jgi:hypothetical protein
MNDDREQTGHFGDTAVLMTAESLFHAGAIVEALAAHDIEALAAPDIQYGAGAHPSSATKPVRVLVHINDLERARAALRQNREDAADINWDDVETPGAMNAVPPPTSPHHARMPMLGKLGFVAAVILIIIMIVGTVLMLLYQ